jgi:hypothetical protein
MMRDVSSVGRAIALAGIAVLFGCTDRGDPTAPPPALEPRSFIVGGGPPPSPPYISNAGVNGTSTLVINGPAASYTATLYNPASSQSVVSLVATIVQGSVQRVVESHSVNCGLSSGNMPAGTCVDGGSFVAASSVAGGLLQAGPATLKLQLKVAATVVSTVTMPLTLVPLPMIVDFRPVTTSLVIDRPGQTASIIFRNETPFIFSNAWVEAAIVQGSVIQYSGYASLACPGTTPGQIQPYSYCEMGLTIGASNLYAGGTLVPGPAQLRLTFKDAARVFDIWPISVTLVRP